MNSPETKTYKKKYELYGLYESREINKRPDSLFLVEGYMDVVNLHKFDIQNVVANLGTAMTEKQIDLIWRFFKNPIICLDGDESGKNAAYRIAEKLFSFINEKNINRQSWGNSLSNN